MAGQFECSLPDSSCTDRRSTNSCCPSRREWERTPSSPPSSSAQSRKAGQRARVLLLPCLLHDADDISEHGAQPLQPARCRGVAPSKPLRCGPVPAGGLGRDGSAGQRSAAQALSATAAEQRRCLCSLADRRSQAAKDHASWPATQAHSCTMPPPTCLPPTAPPGPQRLRPGHPRAAPHSWLRREPPPPRGAGPGGRPLQQAGRWAGRRRKRPKDES
jgi:hypothetical protein